MKKIKRLCINISKQPNKLFLGIIIAYVILFICNTFNMVKSDFLFSISLTIYALYDMFIDLGKYEDETIMENNFLYVILSVHCPIMFIICCSLTSIYMKLFNATKIGEFVIFGIVNIIITITFTTKINRYFKRKIKE